MKFMKRSIGLFLCLFSFFAACKAEQPQNMTHVNEKGVELKLMSYNIRFATSKDTGVYAWKSRREPNIKMFKTEKPDVFGIQEPTTIAMSYLKKRLPQYDSYDCYQTLQ